MTAPRPLLLRGGRLADPARRRAPEADLLVQGGRIAALGAGLAAPEDAEVFDASGHLIHPGLVNAHTHGHGGLARGQGDRWTLELLLAASPWIGGGRSLQDKHLSTLLCAAEMVLKGCTAAYDLSAEVPLPTPEGLDAVAAAYAAAGMRAVVAPMVGDLTLWQAVPGLLDALPAPLRRQVEGLRAAPAEAILAAMADAAAHWRWDAQGIRFALAPTIPTHASDALLCGCRDLARERGLRLHMHVAESRPQALAARARWGSGPVAALDRLGLLGPGFTLAHGVWLADEELRRLAGSGATLAHNPASNMKLGNGLGRLKRALDLGVMVGIGTDGVSSADNANMYEAIRAAAAIGHAQTPDPARWPSAAEVWHAGTQGAAAVLGLEDAGALAPGKAADLVLLDLGVPHWLPHNSTLNQLVWAEDATAVRHVMVGGRWVVRDGRHVSLDMAKLAREAEAARERLEEGAAANRALFEALAPLVAGFCAATLSQPLPVSRYLCEAPGEGP
ncbi:amidohydrolase family protein [Roseococcus sp. DSY-14]|uniref:amidohydrolase family protein n=1 Tax=Roseococcus sp. DSY-14 TaxID=3369650 RepID=UPI00387B6581